MQIRRLSVDLFAGALVAVGALVLLLLVFGVGDGKDRSVARVGLWFTLIAACAAWYARKGLPATTWAASGPVFTPRPLLRALVRLIPAWVIMVVLLLLDLQYFATIMLACVGGRLAGEAVVLWLHERKRQVVLVSAGSDDPHQYLALRQ